MCHRDPCGTVTHTPHVRNASTPHLNPRLVHPYVSSRQRIASWLVSNYPNATMSAVQLITVLRTRGLLAAVREVVKAHPVLILLLTNSATSTAVL